MLNKTIKALQNQLRFILFYQINIISDSYFMIEECKQ